MKEQISFRSGKVSDLDQIIEIAHGGTVHWGKSNYDSLFSPPRRVYVAETDGKIVAFLATSFIIDELEIENIVVSSTHRKRGLAQLLVQHSTSKLLPEGLSRITLEVSLNNHPAVNLYHKLGFSKVGIRKGYYSDGSDALVMELLI